MSPINKTEYIHVRVTESTKTMLKVICAENHRTQSEQLSFMIENEYEDILEIEKNTD